METLPNPIQKTQRNKATFVKHFSKALKTQPTLKQRIIL